MTHRLAATTRTVAFAAAGTAVVAAADLLDRQGVTTGTLVAALGLLVGAFLLARTRQVALHVAEDQIVVQGLLSSHTFAMGEVAGITSSHWNSFIELRDGRSVMTLLRAEDLADFTLAQVVHVSRPAAERTLVTA